jgi:very-short-patch-repair endonuclease
MGTEPTHYFHTVSAIASVQHGVVARAELLDAGITRGQIEQMIRAGTLRRVLRHTYAVGHIQLSDLGRWGAAARAAGRGSAIIGVTSAAYWGIARRRRIPIHVGVPRERTSIPGVRLSLLANLARTTTHTQDGFSVQTVPWTIAQCATWMPCGEVVRMIDDARFRRLLDLEELLNLALDHRGRSGMPNLGVAIRRHLEGERGSDSAFEDRVKLWLEATMGIDMRQNVPAGIFVDGREPRLDLVVEALRLVIECDGPAHDDPVQRRRDQRRDEALRRAGWYVCRVRWADFERDPWSALAGVRSTIERLRAS